MAQEPMVAVNLESTRAIPPAPEASLPAPTDEQIRAADGVFTHSQDSDTVAGLVGLWTGILLLHDLALENFATPPDEDEPAKRQRPPAPDAAP